MAEGFPVEITNTENITDAFNASQSLKEGGSIRSIGGFDDMWAKATTEKINRGANIYGATLATATSTTIGTIQPNTPTECFLAESIHISSYGADCVITLLGVTGPDYPLLSSSQTRFPCSKSGSIHNIPIRDIIDGQISIQISNGNGTDTAVVDIHLNAYRITKDKNFNAEKVILFIGNSITRGTNIGGTVLTSDGSNIYTAVSPEDHYTFQVKQYFQRKGIDCRQVNKAMGNYNSNQIEGWRRQGWLDINQADIIFYMEAVNSAQDGVTDAQYTSNLNKIIDLRDRRYKNKTIIFLGETQVNDDTREARAAQLRTIMQNIATTNINNNVKYLSLADVIPDRKNLTYYNGSDGVHPNIAMNVLMSNKINTYLSTNNIVF